MYKSYERYARIRDALNLNDNRVSIQANLSRQIISNWKRGINKPKYENLKAIAKVIDVDILYLLSEE